MEPKLDGCSLEERGFAAYLFSNPRVRPSGIYRMTDTQAAADTGISVPKAARYLSDLDHRGFIVRDGAWVFVRGYLGLQPRQDRLLAAAREGLEACTSPTIRAAFAHKYHAFGEWCDRTETSVQKRLEIHLRESLAFCGHELVSIQREVRIGSGYADFVLATASGLTIIVEIKRTRADRGGLSQVAKYSAQIMGSTSVLIAKGIAPGLKSGDFAAPKVAMVSYDDAGTCKLIYGNAHIATCEGLLISPSSTCDFTAISHQNHNDSPTAVAVAEQSSTPMSHAAPPVPDGTASGFDAFWHLIPRSRKVNKPDARKAWGKLKPDAALTEKILTTLADQLTWPHLRQEDFRYFPHPHRWLAKRRWEDEVQTSNGAPSLAHSCYVCHKEYVTKNDADVCLRSHGWGTLYDCMACERGCHETLDERDECRAKHGLPSLPR